ncbi:hypothetical protein JXB31_01570 [Candidatus Woesearchaeota archaeon]|nr:hypothetical protein [Candidatus Woesearchaeota archaeon]
MDKTASLALVSALLLVIVTAVTGCNDNRDSVIPLELRNQTDDLIKIPDFAFEEDKALKCDLNGILYYVKGHLVYHLNNKGDEIILTPIGSYTRYSQATRWTLEIFNDRSDSLYTDTLEWIKARKFPNNKEIECVFTGLIPRSFEQFHTKNEEHFTDNGITALEYVSSGG